VHLFEPHLPPADARSVPWKPTTAAPSARGDVRDLPRDVHHPRIRGPIKLLRTPPGRSKPRTAAVIARPGKRASQGEVMNEALGVVQHAAAGRLRAEVGEGGLDEGGAVDAGSGLDDQRLVRARQRMAAQDLLGPDAG